MPDSGEDREIKRRVTAHEAEIVRESKELARKTAQHSVKKNRGAKKGSSRPTKPQK